MDDDEWPASGPSSTKAALQPLPPSSPPTASTILPEGQASYRAAERRLVRKLDLHIIPLVMSLYLFSFLDRVNIGNARLYSLEKDLGLSPTEFQVAVSILFVTYLALEVPSNLVLKLFTPRRWLATIVTAWGLVATLSALVKSYGGLVACRLLLGALEAGLFPGLNVYLTLFYTKRELALRVGYLFVSAAAAGALGGLLAYGIGHLDGARGLHGWRWILLIEGLPAVVLGIVTAVALPNDARDAYFLDAQDKALMEARRRAEFGPFALPSWASTRCCTASQPSSLPSSTTSTSAAAAAYMATAVISDRLQLRGVFCVVFGVISSVGYAVLLADAPPSVHYFACFLVACGLYVVVGLPLAWLPNNSPRYGKRTTATGLQLTLGNVSGILAAFVYPKPDAPRYIRGHAVTLAMVAMGVLIYAFLWLWYCRENRRRANGKLSEVHRRMKDDELEQLGDDSPHYRYTT
uniref:Major facilitator superfamily (MFS) profile domain-containing protein n=1 Tax=Ophiocordyceps unilateralis TaxID=268505 RepID=A0A2A9P3V3_OPHUN|nr:hypothetical protein XA68_18110 [Ophiocordyceps unilateralis]